MLVTPDEPENPVPECIVPAFQPSNHDIQSYARRRSYNKVKDMDKSGVVVLVGAGLMRDTFVDKQTSCECSVAGWRRPTPVVIYPNVTISPFSVHSTDTLAATHSTNTTERLTTTVVIDSINPTIRLNESSPRRSAGYTHTVFTGLPKRRADNERFTRPHKGRGQTRPRVNRASSVGNRRRAKFTSGAEHSG